ncbi:hypothetical protein B0T26DRAFT_872250 [Lasiosphaeria miniovina]|uniref:Uncharacterized protein n=1 Tax=Lasiosphaeria miniovina TaxID=1954250 RepID=A0AA40ALB6_9PEZI|nr:uncharacterized protein B0T26DRAFT_872250 [Lasiosphaeria miniovina]KAK0717929.1 hypothetical protein B0T26DRAFT_872250 [Lasiosphaeria miniovina]
MRLNTQAAAVLALAVSFAEVAEARCTLDPEDLGTYCNGTLYNAKLVKTDSELEVYDRLGGLCPGSFLDAWWDTTIRWWNYPDNHGYSAYDNGKLIQGNQGQGVQHGLYSPVSVLVKQGSLVCVDLASLLPLP